MKRLISLLLSAVLVTSLLAGCSEGGDSGSGGGAGDTAGGGASSGGGDKTINIYAFTDEVPNMLNRYKELHPDFDYEINATIIATTDNAYQPALDAALQGGGKDAPDIYCAEAAFVLKYTQGSASQYAMPYSELGIADVNQKISDAQIAQYTVDIGTRGSDVVGLAYQLTGGAFIYRRSIAKDTWGDDSPATVKSKIGDSWDTFFTAAEELKAKGYAIVSGDGDIWHAIENSSATPWVVDGKLNIDPKREEFLDLSMKLKENDYHNDTQDWQDPWFADMKDAGPKKVLGYYGPAWLINYVMAGNAGDTVGDWAVCEPNVGFFWGGTWLMANKGMDASKKEAVAKFIEWVTLDTSDTGLQSYWAAGTLFELAEGASPTKDTVASGVVMGKSDGTLDFLGGQNMYDAFIPAAQYATGKNLTEFDETINSYWREEVREYTAGNKTREQAITDFKTKVKDNLAVTVE